MDKGGSTQANATRAIALVSGKGGSGKTIVASVLARVLSESKLSDSEILLIDSDRSESVVSQSGKRVLLIDADAGTAGLSYFLTIKQVTNISKGLVELAGESSEPDEPLDEKGFDSGPEANTTEPQRARSRSPIQKMKDIRNASFLCIGDHRRLSRDSDNSAFARGVERVIRDLRGRGEWRWIIVDCRGGSDVHSRAVCEAVDDILLVAEPDTTSYQATQHLVDELAAADLSHKLCGFIINKQFDDPLQVSLSGSAAFRCRYLGSVPFDFAATRSFLVGNIPSESSPFALHVESAAHKLYPDAVPLPAGRVWSRQDFREIGVSDRDSVLGGRLQSMVLLWALVGSLILEFYGRHSIFDTYSIYGILGYIVLLFAFATSFQSIRKRLGRSFRLYLEFIRNLGGKPPE